MRQLSAILAVLFFSLPSKTFSAPQVQIRNVEGKLPTQDSSAVASGSGVIVGKNFILTNRHVVRNDDDTLYEGFRIFKAPDFKTKLDGKVVCLCENYDLALIKTVEELPFEGIDVLDGLAPLATHVTAYGFPLGSRYGVGLTATGGQISRHPVVIASSDTAAEKEVKSALWHDALISHGSSGGPLFSDKDVLVGVNFATLTSEDRRAFAIPSDVVAGFLRQNDVTSDVTFATSVEGKTAKSSAQSITVFVESMGSGDLSRRGAKDDGTSYKELLNSSLKKNLPSLSRRELQVVLSGDLKFAYSPTSSARVKNGDVARITGRMNIIQILEKGMLVEIDGVKFIIALPYGGGGELRAKIGDDVVLDVPVDSLYFVGSAIPYTTISGRESFAIPLMPLSGLSDDENIKKTIAEEKARRLAEEEEKRNRKYLVADGRYLTSAEIAEEKEKKEAKAKEDEAKAKADAAKALEDAKYRTWSSANGQFATSGKPISYGNGIITIETRDGRKIKVPMEKLSDADKVFVNAWRKQH